MYLEYDLFMKVANVSLDIILSNISSPSNALKKDKKDTRIQLQITCELLVNSLGHIKSVSQTRAQILDPLQTLRERFMVYVWSRGVKCLL